MHSKPHILLLGNPNSGKSVLFHQLTGLYAKVANYPGVTVEVTEGNWHIAEGLDVKLVDLPGMYSVLPYSEDEQLAFAVLKEACSQRQCAVLLVLDATRLERSLYLLVQLQRMGFKPVVALNMMDEAQKKGFLIDIPLLEERLGLRVVPVSAIHKQGLQALSLALKDHLQNQTPALIEWQCQDAPEHTYKQVEQWLQGAYDCPVESNQNTNRLDDILLHPFFGFASFFGVLLLAFQALFRVSEPMVLWIESFVGWLQRMVNNGISHSLLRSLLADGIVMGVGNILAFVPLIAVLFFLLGILEDSGYLARASLLLDRSLSRIGLCGRSFVPLLSGFACAVPAIVATRTIPSTQSRLLTILITPLMACSARLPVYGLLISAFFVSYKPFLGVFQIGAVLLLLMYTLGVVIAIAMALLFRRLLFRHSVPALILELPPYRVPKLASVCQNVWLRVRLFLKEAGTTLLAMSIVLWALLSFPRTSEDPQIQLQNSYAGHLGKWMEPALAPLGFDWKIGVGLVASFAAREVFVSTMGVIYGLGTQQEETSPTLREALLLDRNWQTGQPVYTPLVALSLMVFFTLAMQCTSTLAVTKRETKSWRWPLFQLGYMTLLAYLGSLLVFQVGTALGFA